MLSSWSLECKEEGLTAEEERRERKRKKTRLCEKGKQEQRRKNGKGN